MRKEHPTQMTLNLTQSALVKLLDRVLTKQGLKPQKGSVSFSYDSGGKSPTDLGPGISLDAKVTTGDGMVATLTYNQKEVESFSRKNMLEQVTDSLERIADCAGLLVVLANYLGGLVGSGSKKLSVAYSFFFVLIDRSTNTDGLSPGAEKAL
jgi:hypothetical protein